MNETTIVRAIKNDKPKTFYKLYGWREREGIEPPGKRSTALLSDLKSADATRSPSSPNAGIIAR